ncbi:MAG: hemolysin III family protein [Clostridia bacterium]|nr:hemolysin III family protein [Clostridia bacterium]
MQSVKKFNTQSLGEEIANAVSHGVGSLLSIAACVIVIVRAAFESTAIGVVSASIYGASLILLYTFSSLYHSLTNFKAKSVFQIFDHCSIFFLILGTYTPICLAMIRGAMGWTLFGINTFCTVVGITFNAINVKRFHKMSMVLYILMGWSVLISIKRVIEITPFSGMIFLVTGGLLYTIGIVFYKMKSVKYMHFVWHLFVLAGSILHYFFVLFYVFK